MIATVVTAVLVAGCGTAPDMTQGLTAQQILDQAAAKTDALTSYRFGVDLKVDADLAAGTVEASIGQIFADPIRIEGQGGVTEPGDFTFDLTATLGSLPVQANVTKVGGALYASILGQDIKLDVPANTVSSLDVTGLAPSIVSWVKNPEVIGTEEVDGVAVMHIRGVVDTAALADDAGGIVEGLGGGSGVDSGTAGQADAVLEKGTVDVWVGQGDLYIYRADAVVVTTGPLTAAPQLTAIDLDVSARLSDFNGTVQVTAPEGARTVDLGAITGLLGG